MELVHLKNRKRKSELLPKKWDLETQGTHTNTLKLNWNILMITDIFLDQKRVNAFCLEISSFFLLSFSISLLIEKGICDRQNVSVKLPCVCVCAFCLEISSFFLLSFSISLLIEKDICDRQNVSVKLPCVCVCAFCLEISSFFW